MKLNKWLIIPLSISLLGLASCDEDDDIGDCGNGIVEIGEECDDGNEVDNDGCTDECEVSAQAVCGNDIVEFEEECDDGNLVDGDGCDSDCTESIF